MNSWMNSSQYLAQVGHFFGAYSLIFTVGVLWGSTTMFIVFGGGVLLAAIKEFWYDMVAELPKQTWTDSLMDFCFYLFGGCVALVAEHYARVL